MVFLIPQPHIQALFGNLNINVPAHLAYVEWYAPFSDPLPYHNLHSISPMREQGGSRICSISLVADIQ